MELVGEGADVGPLSVDVGILVPPGGKELLGIDPSTSEEGALVVPVELIGEDVDVVSLSVDVGILVPPGEVLGIVGAEVAVVSGACVVLPGPAVAFAPLAGDGAIEDPTVGTLLPVSFTDGNEVPFGALDV